MGGYSLRSSRSSYYSRAEEQRLSLPDSIDGCWCGSETRTDLRNFRSKIFSEQQQQQQEQRMRHLQRPARTFSPRAHARFLPLTGYCTNASVVLSFVKQRVYNHPLQAEHIVFEEKVGTKMSLQNQSTEKCLYTRHNR